MNKINMIRKVFLDHLPRQGKFIDWDNSKGYKVKGIYEGFEFEVEIIDYKEKHIYLKYLDKAPFKIYSSGFKKCQLGKLLGMITNDFKIEIGTQFKDDKRDIVIVDRKYIGNIKNYRYKCNKCGFDGGKHNKKGQEQENHWIDEYGLLKGIGCACCSNIPKIAVLGINTIWDTDRWMCDLGVSEEDAKRYTRCSNEKIIVKCPDCNKEKYTLISNIYIYKSITCNCGDGNSYPNKFMLNLLDQIYIDFISEYSPKWIFPKRYDFYFELNDKKYIIEMDGGLGHGKKVYKNYIKTIEETKAIDDYKESKALLNGIIIIRINCNKSELEIIKKNILEKLSNILNLTEVDWLKCHKFALSNLVKKACNYKLTNPDLTCREIGEYMHISQTTVLSYLNKGTILGWCNYDSKEEMNKIASKMQESNKKQVEIFKNGVTLGIFNSLMELQNQSKELFGVKLNRDYISDVCKNKKKQYLGYTFKFTSPKEFNLIEEGESNK